MHTQQDLMITLAAAPSYFSKPPLGVEAWGGAKCGCISVSLQWRELREVVQDTSLGIQDKKPAKPEWSRGQETQFSEALDWILQCINSAPLSSASGLRMACIEKF